MASQQASSEEEKEGGHVSVLMLELRWVVSRNYNQLSKLLQPEPFTVELISRFIDL